MTRPSPLFGAIVIVSLAATALVSQVQPTDSPSLGNTQLSRLRVVSWNVHQGYSVDQKHVQGAQMDLIASLMPDVIAWQELAEWDNNMPAIYEAGIEKRTGKAWTTLYARHVETSPISAAQGSALMTWLPVDAQEVLRLDYPANPTDSVKNRAAIRFQITVNDVPVHLVTTHLDHLDPTNRRSQLDRVQSWLGMLGPSRIVTGDFNADPTDPTTWADWRSGYTDVWPLLTSDKGWTMDLRSVTKQPGRIDYQWHAGVEPVAISVIKTTLSDHHAVLADYRIAPPPPPPPPLPLAFAKRAPADDGAGELADPTLEWEPSEGATSYEYCVDLTNDNQCDVAWTGTGSVTSANLTGLDPATTYYWQVRALNAVGSIEGDGGNWWRFTTALPAPGGFGKSAPSDGATGQTANPALSWQPATDAISYQYCIDTTDDSACDSVWTSTGSETSANLTGLMDGTTYWWQVRATNTAATTEADGGIWWSLATQAQPVVIAVVSPEGGESWDAGTSHLIQWAGPPNAIVTIELLKNGAVSTVLAPSVATGPGGSGSFNWTIAGNQAGGGDYRVRISSTTDATATDTSDASFTILPATFAVVSPNGDESWPGGTVHEIQWAYTANPGPNVRLELLKNGVVSRVITSSTPIGTGGTGAFTWTVPAGQAPGTDYRVRVMSTAATAIRDTSDGNFAIVAPTLAVVAPNGGESLQAGATHQIQWTYTGNTGPNVKIELLKNGALNRVIKSSTPIGSSGSGSFAWPIPAGQAGGADYRVRVTSTAVTSLKDTSDADFSIEAPTLTLVAPNGGETFGGGTTQQIQWSYTGNAGANVKIELLKDGAVNRVIKSSTPIGTGGTGSFAWTIPATQTPGTDYRVRVTSATVGTVLDVSDATFSIAAPTLAVVAPNGGESWARRTAQQIQWSYTGVPGTKVKIELLKNNVVNRVIASGAPIGSGGGGTFPWTVPAGQALGNDYQVRVTSTTVPSVTASSDALFSVVP
jgi:endonuclease/exonuclease/phosphatase family metal-dependent hydrolase